jgi:hypothetical protein
VFLDRAEELWALTTPESFDAFAKKSWADGLAFYLPVANLVTNFTPKPTVPPLRGRGRGR